MRTSRDQGALDAPRYYPKAQITQGGSRKRPEPTILSLWEELVGEKLPSGIRPGVGSGARIARDCLGRPIFMMMIERDDCSPSRCIAKSGGNDQGPLR
jgi:hypothetical protein